MEETLEYEGSSKSETFCLESSQECFAYQGSSDYQKDITINLCPVCNEETKAAYHALVSCSFAKYVRASHIS